MNCGSLKRSSDDPDFLNQWRQVKLDNKREQADYVHQKTGVTLNTGSLFDVQVKRIHEYKRQHLNVLHIITLYNRIKKNPDMDIPPRTFIFGGKAAPGYYMAKLIIKLINSVAEVVNHDPGCRRPTESRFYPQLQRQNRPAHLSRWPICPSRFPPPGKEASGTGNMKFSMNGALTIGTLDGANVEIREEVGAENFFLFGLTAQEVDELEAPGIFPMTISANT